MSGHLDEAFRRLCRLEKAMWGYDGGLPSPASSLVSKRDNLDASDKAAGMVGATRETISCEEVSGVNSLVSSDDDPSTTGAENASKITPSLDAMTGTSSANKAGGEPCDLPSGIYVVSNGQAHCIHAGLPAVVNLPNGWRGA